MKKRPIKSLTAVIHANQMLAIMIPVVCLVSLIWGEAVQRKAMSITFMVVGIVHLLSGLVMTGLRVSLQMNKEEYAKDRKNRLLVSAVATAYYAVGYLIIKFLV